MLFKLVGSCDIYICIESATQKYDCCHEVERILAFRLAGCVSFLFLGRRLNVHAIEIVLGILNVKLLFLVLPCIFPGEVLIPPSVSNLEPL